MAWCAGVGTFFKVRTIGNFTADEARAFFNTRLKDAISNDDWLRVFEVSPGCVA